MHAQTEAKDAPLVAVLIIISATTAIIAAASCIADDIGDNAPLLQLAAIAAVPIAAAVPVSIAVIVAAVAVVVAAAPVHSSRRVKGMSFHHTIFIRHT